MGRTVPRWIGGLVVATACAGCRSGAAGPSTPPGTVLSRLTVTSSAFGANGAIPVDCTCDGSDRSPPLTWSAVPAGTRSVAIVVEDPDAAGGDFTHWVAFDLSPEVTSLPEGADVSAANGTNGSNDFRRVGYSGPCPPKMEIHRYVFRVFALDVPLKQPAGASRSAVQSAMHGHVLAEGSLVGTYSH